MKLLALRTDKPEAELYVLKDDQVFVDTWHAHRELSITIHHRLQALLNASGLTLQEIEGIICYADGGSFTGLRIGAAVANALSKGLSVPVVPGKGSEWLVEGRYLLESGNTPKSVYVQPDYGTSATTTLPKK